MKALILAAGLGSRLRPLTDEVPKCMVKVNGVSIIDKQIQNLKENGVNELFVVTGYKGDILEKHIIEKYNALDIKILHNDVYDRTNNMYSLKTYEMISWVFLLETFLDYPSIEEGRRDS